MTDRELMQMALDAIEAALSDDQPYISRSKETVEALRSRLAQPEPKYQPMHPELRKMYEDYFDVAFEKLVPPQREWQGLTDEEVIKLGGLDKDSDYFGLWYDFARAIEAKLKQKNGGSHD